jgi:hypothetical protein
MLSQVSANLWLQRPEMMELRCFSSTKYNAEGGDSEQQSAS